jgi:hypothetical protein
MKFSFFSLLIGVQSNEQEIAFLKDRLIIPVQRLQTVIQTGSDDQKHCTNRWDAVGDYGSMTERLGATRRKPAVQFHRRNNLI